MERKILCNLWKKKTEKYLHSTFQSVGSLIEQNVKIIHLTELYTGEGLLRWHSGKECKRWRRSGFNPWVRKNRWRKTWQPTPIFACLENPTEDPGRLQSMGSQSHKDLSTTECACMHVRVFYIQYRIICKQWQFCFFLSSLDSLYFSLFCFMIAVTWASNSLELKWGSSHLCYLYHLCCWFIGDFF